MQDWDLKMSKGNCLNSLGEAKFDISMSALLSPGASTPKAVKRVHEIFENATFLEGKIDGCDVKQGGLGDCWLMAGFTGLANVEGGIRKICVEYDTSECRLCFDLPMVSLIPRQKSEFTGLFFTEVSTSWRTFRLRIPGR